MTTLDNQCLADDKLNRVCARHDALRGSKCSIPLKECEVQETWYVLRSLTVCACFSSKDPHTTLVLAQQLQTHYCRDIRSRDDNITHWATY